MVAPSIFVSVASKGLIAAVRLLGKLRVGRSDGPISTASHPLAE